MRADELPEADLRSAMWRAGTLADAIKLSLANLRLRMTLQDQAVRDVLTGLYNRRHFDQTLAHEVSRTARAHEPLALAIVDIDHFKSFNDAFGHEAGDEVIRAVAGAVKAFGRDYDVACRIGGEELAVLMPRSRAADTEQGPPDDLVRRADTALYAAKRAGRDQVCLWNGPPQADAPDSAFAHFDAVKTLDA